MMFCYQCEQTAGGAGYTKIGVCGKNEDIQSLQDTLNVFNILKQEYNLKLISTPQRDLNHILGKQKVRR